MSGRPRKRNERRWRRLPSERPGQILTAAVEVFTERGITNVTVAEIAERAGISKATVYLYFESKTELVRAAMERVIGSESERIALAPRVGSARIRVNSMLTDLWFSLRRAEFQGIYRVVIVELPRNPELAAIYSEQINGRIMTALTRLLNEGVESGEFRDREPQTTARLLMSIFLTHALWCERPTVYRYLAETNDADVLAELLTFCADAICPGDEPPAEPR